MQITKCDICKKQIKKSEGDITVRHGYVIPFFSFCLKCGKPIANFLRRKGLIDKNKKARKK